VDSTRARRSVVYAIDMDVLDREQYSQSGASDREPRSRTPVEIDVFHSVTANHVRPTRTRFAGLERWFAPLRRRSPIRI